MKTPLDFLNEVSIEKDFPSWYYVVVSQDIESCIFIPQEAAKRFATYCLNLDF